MKKYLGQIIFNLIMAAAALVIFSNKSVSDSFFLFIGFIILLMAVLSAGNYFFIQTDSREKKAVITEETFRQLETPQDYINVMKKLADCNICSAEANKIIGQWEIFLKKSETLNTISSGGGVYDVVNQDVENFMLKNMKLFMKRTAIMQSASDSEEIKLHKAYLHEITESGEKILDDYTRLLVEASQITENGSGNSGVESLEMLIGSMKNYRNSLEKGDIQ
ncbi:MAG: hypothetical protein IJ666_00960 [Ruminococcus sp.]|nr:hypothetical protein [Ruminococcus sp.]